MTDTLNRRPELDPMNPQQVAYEIARLSGILEESTAQYAIDIEAAAQQQAHLKGSWARSMLAVIASNGKMTVSEREAHVEVEINAERITADIAEARSKATREHLRGLDTQINALRSLGANLRVHT